MPNIYYMYMEFDKITIAKTKELLNKNKDGITLKLNGSIDHKKRGYYVSVTNNTFKELTIKDIYSVMLKAYLYEKQNNIKAFIGGWFSSKTKNWYIDISLYFDNKQEALKVARAKKQEAIFNIKKLETVFI